VSKWYFEIWSNHAKTLSSFHITDVMIVRIFTLHNILCTEKHWTSFTLWFFDHCLSQQTFSWTCKSIFLLLHLALTYIGHNMDSFNDLTATQCLIDPCQSLWGKKNKTFTDFNSNVMLSKAFSHTYMGIKIANSIVNIQRKINTALP